MPSGEHRSYSGKRYLDVSGHPEQTPGSWNASFLNTTDFKFIEVYNSLIEHQSPFTALQFAPLFCAYYSEIIKVIVVSNVVVYTHF